MHLAAWIVATFCLTRSCVGSQTEPTLTLQLWPAGILQADNAYTPPGLRNSVFGNADSAFRIRGIREFCWGLHNFGKIRAGSTFSQRPM